LHLSGNHRNRARQDTGLASAKSNLNAYLERYIRSILCFGEGSLRRVLNEYVAQKSKCEIQVPNESRRLCPFAFIAEAAHGFGETRRRPMLAHLGHKGSDQTVGDVPRRQGTLPTPERKRTSTTWAEFIRAHLAVSAGADFFTVEVLTVRGLVTYYWLLSSWQV
jgi:hypothetical protein